jgi:transcriptional regulator with XRE-family HTH domain
MRADGEKMKVARKAAHKSQEWVAAEMTDRLARTEPVHFTTLSRWENGHNQPDLESLIAYAGCVGVGDFRMLLETQSPLTGVSDITLADLAHDLLMLVRKAQTVVALEDAEAVSL